MSVDAVLRDIEAASGREYLPIIGADKARFLDALVSERRPCLCVDIGSLTGYATIIIAQRLADGCHVVGVEINDELAKRAANNIASAGLADRAEIRRGDAKEVIGGISGPIDLVFLDAQKSQYGGYLRQLLPKLSPGAAVVANGTGLFQRECAAYLDFVRRSGRFDSRTVPFGDDAIEISIFKG